MPPTIDIRLFWTSAVLLVIVLSVAPRTASSAKTKSASGRRIAVLLAVLGFGMAALLFYPLLAWKPDEPVFGQLFGWLCAHGMIAALYVRMRFYIVGETPKERGIARDRLKTETVTGSIHDGKNGNATYSYDTSASRLSSLPGIVNQAFSYDANDRLNGDQYDNNGNTKSAPVSQPSALNAQQILGSDDYDSENRLTQRTSTNGSTVRLVYDGDGNRVQEVVNGETKSYLIDDRNPTGYAQVVEEIVNGVVNHTYTYGHDLISQDQVDPSDQHLARHLLRLRRPWHRPLPDQRKRPGYRHYQ